MKKILLTIILLLVLSSCKNIENTEDKMMSSREYSEERTYMKTEMETYSSENTAESNIIEITVENSEASQENYTEERPPILTPYTLDEVKNIFKEGRELFEKIKDICVKLKYKLYVINLLNTEYYKEFLERGLVYIKNGKAYSIKDVDGYELIEELCNKYNIGNIMAHNYIDSRNQQRTSGIKFKILWSWGYEQLIVYSETDGVSEDVKDEHSYGRMKLDDNWYYELIQHPD